MRRPTRASRRAVLAATAVAAMLSPCVSHGQSARDLTALSLEELSEVEVTSVSKRAERLAQAPAAVYVITAEDIHRSGATTLAEALRLAPNLEVARVDSRTYNISARGLNSVNASNKVLALIDGRSIYTPFFSSVFWDQQEVMLADIERIEVISGPGGTLWGSNAMNGVINVITRSSADTQGGLVDAQVGGFVQRGAGRWGGKLGSVGTWRGYALGFGEGPTYLPGGTSAMDGWRAKQAGFRSDIPDGRDLVTVQGDTYENLVDSPGGRRSGANLLGRWTRHLAAGGTFEVQAYYDQQNRADLAATGGGSAEELKTFDVEAQHSFEIGSRHRVVWGAGQRVWRDRFVNTANPFVLLPESQTLSLANLFGQDTVALSEALKLIVGMKFEYSTLSGWDSMPNVRLGWQASGRDYFWAAISRAVRSPSRLERDLTAPGIVDTSPDFVSEKLVAYETGWRSQLGPHASIAASAYYDVYSDLRTTAPAPQGVFPVTFGNGLEGHTYGIEAWGSMSPRAGWRIDAGAGLLRKSFHLKPGESDLAGVQTVLGHDPGHQVFLRSYVDLPHQVELYVGLRHVGGLPDVAVPAYFATDVRLGWHVTPNLELSVGGTNVLDSRHAEATEPPIHDIPRSGYAGIRMSF